MSPFVRKEMSGPHVCIAVRSFIAFHPGMGSYFFNLNGGGDLENLPVFSEKSNEVDMCGRM